MAHAAYLSGKAITTTRTTLPHALAYFLTKRYGLAHGHAVALTVPYCILINTAPDAKITTSAGPAAHRQAMQDLTHLLGQGRLPEDAVIFWRNLMKHCGLKSTLAEAGLATESQFKELIASIDPTRLGNHPVAVTPELLLRYFMQWATGSALFFMLIWMPFTLRWNSMTIRSSLASLSSSVAPPRAAVLSPQLPTKRGASAHAPPCPPPGAQALPQGNSLASPDGTLPRGLGSGFRHLP